MEKKVLGRGISALIPGGSNLEDLEKQEKIIFLKLDKIRPNPYQPREDFNSQSLEELTQSIKEKGLIQPVIVRRHGDLYELIAGERRFRAANLLHINEIPAIIKDVNDEESLEISLIENIQRQALNPIEEGRAFQYLIDKFGVTQERIGEVIGKSRVTVTNILRLLKLPKEILDEIKRGKISSAHGRLLLEIQDAHQQRRFAQEIVAKDLSVGELENLIKSHRPKRIKYKVSKDKIGKDPYLVIKEEELQQILGTKVNIKRNRKRGCIQIEFYSSEDLERILKILTSK
jgi:ParB family chromosome partitioning protein